MEPNLETRKLLLVLKSELIKLLERDDSWKKLMAAIPETLPPATGKCEISLTNTPKYSSEDFYTFENAAKKKGTYCSEILLREWVTSGRVRPALAHLTYLLVKTELFRAADYMTVDVLKQESPARPNKGPAAPVCFNSDELEDSQMLASISSSTPEIGRVGSQENLNVPAIPGLSLSNSDSSLNIPALSKLLALTDSDY